MKKGRPSLLSNFKGFCFAFDYPYVPYKDEAYHHKIYLYVWLSKTRNNIYIAKHRRKNLKETRTSLTKDLKVIKKTRTANTEKKIYLKPFLIMF